MAYSPGLDFHLDAGRKPRRRAHPTVRVASSTRLSPVRGTLSPGGGVVPMWKGSEGSMSDVSQGPGWWQASDGKWYPPQPQQNPAPAPTGADTPLGPGWWQATDGKWYPPQPGFPGQVAPKKPVYKRVWFWLLVVLASVTGSGTADINWDTFAYGNSGSSQDSGAALPWTKTVTGSGLFNIYSVTAQLQSGTSVTCSITVDGRQVSTHTSTGQFAIADCTGSAP